MDANSEPHCRAHSRARLSRVCETLCVSCAPDLLNLELRAPESQRIRNHRDRTETHCRAGNHWIEKQSNTRIERAGSDRHAERVVNEGEEQTLPNVAHGRATAGAVDQKETTQLWLAPRRFRIARPK
jgi:hypothetical protein